MKISLVEAAILVCLALVPALGQALYYRDKVSWHSPVAASDEITVPQALALRDSALWVDARADEEYAREHVPGALPLNQEHWDEQLLKVVEAWSPEKRVVVYCSSKECGASREVARRLRSNAGLTNVMVLTGGWEAWVDRRR